MKALIISIITILLIILGIHFAGGMNSKESGAMKVNLDHLKTATFAGGCFWCVESDFEKVDGVVEVISGYTGGRTENPAYEEVSSGGTGHVEAVQVHYDPEKIGYRELLDVFWKHVNPTDPGGQFVDRGDQYQSAIFYHDDEQKSLAEISKAELEKSGHFDKPIVTEIRQLDKFYPAEEYHQDYYKKNPVRYNTYRYLSGRDKFLKQAWPGTSDMFVKSHGNNGKSGSAYAKPGERDLRERLTPLQFKVTQEEGTEPPFKNEYWDNKKDGIYVDIVSGEPLFSSRAKYKSGTGWPSFTQPLEPDNIVEKEDRRLFTARTEVRSKYGDSHLGHVFPDGPKPTGLRYCINSASLKFIPKEDLEKEGYGRYLKLFH